MRLPRIPALQQQWLSAALLWILPNIVFWWTAHAFGYQRPLFNLDYGLALAAWVLGWRKSGMVLALLALGLDVLAAAAQVYLLYEPLQLLSLLQFATLARPAFLWAGALFLLGSVLLFALLSHLAPKAGGRAVLAMLCPLVLLNIPSLWQESQKQQANLQLDHRLVVLGSQWDMLHRNLFRSDIGFAVANAEGAARFSHSPIQPASAMAWGNAAALPAQMPARMLLVVAESWGLPWQPQRLQAQLQPLLAQPGRIQVLQQGTVAFAGGTVAGELRELCQVQSSEISFGAVTLTDRCLPLLLQQRGYRTHGVHAASGLMYRRLEWFASAGLQDATFFQNYAGQARRCYSFPGWCDVDLMPHVSRLLQQTDRSFVYWLTLNSHVPYDRRDILDSGHTVACEGLFGSRDGDLCRHFALGLEFFDALARMLQDPALSGLEVVVVGDHAPAFLDKTARAAFDSTRVPFIHLRVQ